MTEKIISARNDDVKTFYVYTHRKKSDGSIFYVGKGSGLRAWNTQDRSTYWTRVAAKYGYSVNIEQEFTDEDKAFLLEMWLIAKLKKQGVKLTNIAEGGQGPSGNVLSEAVRAKMRDAKGGKPVYCSNGTIYVSAREASRSMGRPNNSSSIALVLAGKRASAFGHSWAHDGFPSPPIFTSGSGHRPIKTECGLNFKSVSDAARYMKCNGYPNAKPSTITAAMITRSGKIYKKVWLYA